MAESQLGRDLIYGDLGKADYDSHEKRWEFSRRPGKAYVLRWLGKPLKVLDGSPVTIPEKSHYDERVKSNNHILQVHSTFGGLHSLYEADRIFSEALAKTLSFYDPSVGDVLGSGQVKAGFHSDLIPVYACPGGQSGWSLRVAETYLEESRLSHGVDGYDEIIRVPTFTGDVRLWAGTTSPVRQVCFSDLRLNSSEGQLLGVRFSNSTVIFEVKHCRSRLQSDGYGQSNISSLSNLDLQKILEIPFKDKFDGEHADLSFNTWNRRQIAVVNRVGEWAISEFTPRNHPAQLLYPIRPKYEGIIQLSPTEDSRIMNQNNNTSNKDGWVRVRWILNANTLVLCNRTLLQLVDIRSKFTVHVNLSRRKDPQWHLDIRICDSWSDQCFLLTTSFIYWIKIIPASEAIREGETSLSYNVLLAIQHFRDPWDITMQMKVLEERNHAIVLIHSRSNPIISCFRFSYSAYMPTVPILYSAPTQLTLPATICDQSAGTPGIADLHIKSLSSHVDGGFWNEDESVRVYELMILSTDFSLWQTSLFCEQYLTTRHIEITQSYSNSNNKRNSEVHQSFVVPDGMELDQLPPYKQSKSKPYVPGMDKFVVGKLKRRDEEFQRPAIKMKQAYDQLIDLRLPICSVETEWVSTDFQTPQSSNDIELWIQDVRSIWNQDFRGSSVGKTLLDYCEIPYQILDVERALDTFDGLKESLNEYVNNRSGSTSFELLYSLDFESFRSLFHSVVQNFINPFEEHATASYQKRRSEIIKMIAAELFLATVNKLGLHRPTPQLLTRRETILTSTDELSSTVTMLGASPERLMNKNRRQALPAPNKEERVHLLEKYVNLIKPLPVTYKVSERLLEHWTLGEDPSDYNYLARALSDRRDEQLEDMTEEARIAALKKQERRTQRQAQESQKFSQRSQQLESIDMMGFGQQHEILARGHGDSQSLLRSALRPSTQLESDISIGSPSQHEERVIKEKDHRRKTKKTRTKGF